MHVVKPWFIVLFAASLLAVGACSDSKDDGPSRVCMDGSAPLASTGVCELPVCPAIPA